MAYLARNADKRIDPRRVLPGARSIVLLATSYHQPPEPKPAGQTPKGCIARYARHEDYHDVLGRSLKALASYLDQVGGPQSRSLWYVDTGPFLERDLAQRAGLGFVGKHTNLIRRPGGNWSLLSLIITTLPLTPNAPEKNRCGSWA